MPLAEYECTINIKGNDDSEIVVVVPTSSINNTHILNFVRSLNTSAPSSLKVVEVISTGNEFNFAKSMNTGIEEALKSNPEFILLSNDDVLFGDHWIEPLLNALRKDRLIGYALPLINSHSYFGDGVVSMPHYFSIYLLTSELLSAVKPFLHSVLKLRELMKSVERSANNGVFEVKDEIPYGSMANSQPVCLMRTKTLLDIGSFDSRFNNGIEDFDLSMRVYLAGLKVGICLDSQVSHLGSATGGERWSAVLSPESVLNAGQIQNWRHLLNKYSFSEYRRFLRNARKNTILFGEVGDNTVHIP